MTVKKAPSEWRGSGHACGGPHVGANSRPGGQGGDVMKPVRRDVQHVSLVQFRPDLGAIKQSTLHTYTHRRQRAIGRIAESAIVFSLFTSRSKILLQVVPNERPTLTHTKRFLDTCVHACSLIEQVCSLL